MIITLIMVFPNDKKDKDSKRKHVMSSFKSDPTFSVRKAE